VSGKVLDLLAEYRSEGRIVWLELGLQSAFDETLRRVNRGHNLKEYRKWPSRRGGAAFRYVPT